MIAYLANIYVSAKKRGKSTENFITQIRKVRRSSLTSSVAKYLKDIGLSWSDHPSFQRVKTEEVVIALGEILSGNPSLFNPINEEYSDLNQMLRDIDFRPGDKISFIGHSQGNLYQNRLAEILVHEKGVDRNDIRVLSVATPDDYVFNHGKYVTLKEDYVAAITFFGSLPRNMTNYSDTKILGSDLVQNISNGDLTGHGFREHYMRDGTRSKDFIVENFRKNFFDLKNSKRLYEDFYLTNTTISKSKISAGDTLRFQTYINYTGERTQSEIGTSYVVYFHYGKATDNKLEYIGYDRSTIGSDDPSDREYVNITFPDNYPSGYSLLCALAYHSGYSDEEDKGNNFVCKLFEVE